MTREDKLALSGDYVLGLLDTAEMRAFEDAARTDPELADMAQRFATRLSALDETAAPEGHSPTLWQRIEQRIDSTAPVETENVVTLAPRRRPVWASQWLPLAASVVVALGLGYLVGAGTSQSSTPTVVAVLLSETDASPAVIIEAFADDSVRLVPLDNFSAPQGQVLQVWTLPDPATGPVSLGTLPATRDIRLDGPNLPLPQPGQLYEITLEPAPGSPTGRPTGPILVKGFAKQPVS